MQIINFAIIECRNLAAF